MHADRCGGPHSCLRFGAMVHWKFLWLLQIGSCALATRPPQQIVRSPRLSATSAWPPKTLDDWERLPDGRILGRIQGAEVWITPKRGAEMSSSRVVSKGGQAYSLGEPRAAKDDETPRRSLARRVRDASATRAAVAFVLMCGALGFYLGAGLLDGETEYIHQRASSSTSQQPLARTAATPAFDRASLTVGEQRSRLQLRVDTDRLELRNLEAQMRRDGLVVDEETYAARVREFREKLRADAADLGGLRVANERAWRQDEEEQVMAYKRRVLEPELQRAASAVERLQLRIRTDEETLREISRVAAERGAEARAVQIVFP